MTKTEIEKLYENTYGKHKPFLHVHTAADMVSFAQKVGEAKNQQKKDPDSEN